MEVTDTLLGSAAPSSTFSLRIGIGQFLLILLLANEVVIRPLQELFKDDIVHCAARGVVARGNAVQIRSAPLPLRAMGVPTVIRGRRGGLFITQGARIALMIFLIIALALFERSVDQNRVATVSNISTTSLRDADSLVVPDGRTILMSPFPVFGLNEQEAANIRAFSPNGTNSSENYIVREESNLASRYISACVRQVNDSYSTAYVGAVVQIEGTQTIQCLDGTGGSDNRTAAQFFSDAPLSSSNVSLVTLSALENENEFSSDGTTGVYAAKVVDDSNLNYEGYVAVTLRSHFDANVEWSMYGLVRGEGAFVYRVAIRLGRYDPPCYGERPSKQYMGNWSFNGTHYACPDGDSRPVVRVANEELQTVALEIFAVSSQVRAQRNGDLLAWLIETDYARFAGAQTFALELRTRVRSDRMFYSQHEGEELLVTNGAFEERVTMGVWETVVLCVAIGCLLVSIVVSWLWKTSQHHKYRMDSEVVNLDAIARMYSIEATGNEHAGKLLLHVGLTDTMDDAQHLGIVHKGISSVRRPELALL